MEDLMRQLLVDQSFKNNIFPMIPHNENGNNNNNLSEPKPQHSYIGLIAMAILSASQKKMVLSEVYEWIMTEYPYFRSRGAGWRNSIRHNLSLNDCFVKAGRAANGKGHYWSVHPACMRDFERGDFRRRRAQRKVRRHMGLSVEEDDSSDEGSSSTPPIYLLPPLLQVVPPFNPIHLHGVPHNRIKSFTIEAILAHT